MTATIGDFVSALPFELVYREADGRLVEFATIICLYQANAMLGSPPRLSFGICYRIVSTASATVSPSAAAAPAQASDAPVLPFRVGYGFDLHRLVEGKKLIICGVEVPHVRGCDAHSDGTPRRQS